MKLSFNKIIVFIALVAIWSCKKDEVRAVIDTSAASPITLNASSTTLVLDSADAANKNAVIFNWDAVQYGTDVAIVYTLQLDSLNGDFSKPVAVEVGSELSKAYTEANLNTIVQNLGLTPGTSGQIQARVKAVVSQSGTAASVVPVIYSNVLKLTVTPYSTKPQPKYPVPDGLYIVGDATPGGWDNPVPVPSQKFTKIDDNTFGIVIELIGGKEYLLIPKNGDWSHKYAVPDHPDPMSGNFVPDASNNIPAPAASGVYTIIVDFVKGTYTLTAGNPYKVPSNLYIVGDATPGGWDNPVPVPSQQFNQISNGEFEITLPLTGGKSYLFLPLNGDWGHKFGGASKTGGALLADNNVPSSNTPAPDASGTYKINVNFFAQQYTVTQ